MGKTKLEKEIRNSLFPQELCAGMPLFVPLEEEGKCSINSLKCPYYRPSGEERVYCIKGKVLLNRIQLVMENP